MLTKRSHQREWMDLGPPFYTKEEYEDCLFQLDRVGRFLGGDRATFSALDLLPKEPKSILDVGCGGGLFTMRLAARYPNAKIVGIDISQEAIDFAQKQLKKHSPQLSNVTFFVPDSPALDESVPFDVVLSTLTCHHLSDEELVSFLQQANRVAKQAVILNDLHRHLLATIGFFTLAPFVFPNRMIWHDGLLSIRRSFTRKDWEALLQAAGIPKSSYRLTWHFAFRWIVMIHSTRIIK